MECIPIASIQQSGFSGKVRHNKFVKKVAALMKRVILHPAF